MRRQSWGCLCNEFRSLEYPRVCRWGTKRIATLSDPYQEPDDCSVDRTTGNLAVANIGGSVSIYEGARGHPKQRTDSEIAYMFFLSYDGRGALFVDGENDHFDQFELAELPAGGKRFAKITLDQTIGFPGGVEWDGNHLALGDQDQALIYRFTISGSSGTKIGTVQLERAADVSQFWIRWLTRHRAESRKWNRDVLGLPGRREADENHLRTS